MAQTVLAGASGYSFKEWKGEFYPATIRPDAMLAYYAERLATVELNNSFYALPKRENVERWAATVPDAFRFAIKAPAAITHRARLKPSSTDDLDAFYAVIAHFGAKRGPVLFQLPPNLRKDLPRLVDFLARLPQRHGASVEFRHDSWFDDAVYDALHAAGAALCISEREDAGAPPLIETADWGYLRLRLETYTRAGLQRWIARCRETRWTTVHTYFMHEPTAPAYAQMMMELAGARG
jgi:uncharacterized protein YecE (DUF72 family)